MTTSDHVLEESSAIAKPVFLLPAVIGFFFSFRLITVLLTAKIMLADPQVGVVLSLGLNYLLLAVVVFLLHWPRPKNFGIAYENCPVIHGYCASLCSLDTA